MASPLPAPAVLDAVAPADIDKPASPADPKAFPYPSPPVLYPYYPQSDAPPFYRPDTAVPAIPNLPPPDIARSIPCRYFPACRYGPSCIFAHPQHYFPPALPPPAPFGPPYDPAYPPNYFPPPFQPSSPPSDVQPSFTPAPFGPLSPSAYPHPGHTPVPIMLPPLPPPHLQPAPIYNPPSAQQPEAYPTKPQDPAPQDPPTNSNPPRDPPVQRRASRRSPFPPCLFYPAGRCKNGAECRFPHIPPDANAPHHVPYYSARGPKPPRQPNGPNNITDKMAGLSLRDDAPGRRNGLEGRPHSADTNRPRYHQPAKNAYPQNGPRAEKRPPPPKQQRVPNADEFPVLAGANTPPTRNSALNGLSNGHPGPTAAQVLSAPAPSRKDATPKDSSTRGASPDLKSAKAESTGESAATTPDHPAKLPISFAAVAAPEQLPKEIALSA